MTLFKKKLGQNEQLLENIRLLDEKKKIKQQKSKVLVKRKIKRTKNKEKNINVYNPRRSKSIWSLVRERLNLWNV